MASTSEHDTGEDEIVAARQPRGAADGRAIVGGRAGMTASGLVEDVSSMRMTSMASSSSRVGGHVNSPPAAVGMSLTVNHYS